jgi:hypothetical protein
VTQSAAGTLITVNGGPVDWAKVVAVDQVAPTATASNPTTPPASS